MYPNSPYPKLQAANGSTITIRHGTPESFLRAIDEVREGRMGFCKAGRLYGVSHATLQKYYKAMGYTLRNQTNNPNFRKRPDGTPVDSRRRYNSVPAGHHVNTINTNTQNLFPHIILNTGQGCHPSVQNDNNETKTPLSNCVERQELQSKMVVRGPFFQKEQSLSPYMRINSGDDKEVDTTRIQDLQSPSSGLHFTPSQDLE